MDSPNGNLMKIFDLYQDFVLSGAKVDPSLLEKPLAHIPKPAINTTNNIFLQKIIEMNLYGDEEDASPEKTKESVASSNINEETKSKSDKTNDSTKSNIDSGSSSDDLQESDINPDHDNADECNLNTESANERVDSFLDTLDNLSQEFLSDGSQISATTYTVTNKAPNNEKSSSSGSESDDEGSKSGSGSGNTNSIASNRGSDSYQNEIDDTNGSESDNEDQDEEEFFEAAENLEQQQRASKSPRDGSRPKSGSAMSYHINSNAQNRWTNMYWKQATQIADYVNHWRFVQQQQKLSLLNQ